MAQIQNYNISIGTPSGVTNKTGNNYSPTNNWWQVPFEFTAYPAIGFRIKSVTLNNVAVADPINPTGWQTFTFPVIKNSFTYYIVVNFEEIPVAPPADNYTTIEVAEGAKICYSITYEGEFVRLVAPEGKTFGYVQLNGSPVTLTDPEQPVIFVPKGKNLLTFCTLAPEPPPPPPYYYLVTVLTNLNNTGVSPQSESVLEGDDFSTVITPPSGYVIGSIKINDTPFTGFTPSGYTLNLTNITQITTITVVFTEVVTPPAAQTLQVIWSGGLGVTATVDNVAMSLTNGLIHNVAANVQIRLTIQLLSGFSFDNLVRNSVGQSVTFSGGFAVYEFNSSTINQVVNITASPIAGPTLYAVNVFLQGGGSGTASPQSATLAGGSPFSTTITPLQGHYVHSAYIQGDPDFLPIPAAGGTINTTTKTNQNTVIFVRFERYTYTVFTTLGANGTASNTLATVNWGGSYVVGIYPNSGYEIDTITVNGSPITVTNRAIMNVSLTNIISNQTVHATFRLIPVQLLRIYVSFGTIANPNPSMGSLLASVSPTPPFIEVSPNTAQTLSSATLPGYQFGTVTLNGAQIHSGGTSFTYNIASNQMTIDYYLVIEVLAVQQPA